MSHFPTSASYSHIQKESFQNVKGVFVEIIV